MTPAARVAAAIEVLDLILDGSTPEKALTGWGRSHRFAGSKDRAAIRDHVFQALRCRASYGWVGGAETGRGIMIGATSLDGTLEEVFTGVGHAPLPLTEDEVRQDLATAPRDVRVDMPDWVLPLFDEAFGVDADDVMICLQTRAGAFLRVNAARTSVENVAAALAQDGITTRRLKNVNFGLQVIENERRVAQSDAYSDGLVELQDASSQRAIETLAPSAGQRVLDYCAGGGGKALAIAATGAVVTAHDIDPRRMVDLAPRAQRAGVRVDTRKTDELLNESPFDIVFCDAPCSGSGTWRRTPTAKWALTPDRLAELTKMQDEVLMSAAPLVRFGGLLAYATCSVFTVENTARIEAFLAQNAKFELVSTHPMTPSDQGDGFYLAVLKRTT